MLQNYQNAVAKYDSVDCRILSAVNSINRLGCNIDPVTYYGLSKGLSFSLLEAQNNNIITVPYARSKGSEIDFIRDIGFDVQVISPQNIDEIDEYLEKGYSVIIDVDRYYLPPFTEKFGASHFGYHSTNIIGYDFCEDGKIYYGLEFLRSKPYIYTIAQIQMARFSQCDFIQPNGQVYIISGKQEVVFDNDFYVRQVKCCAFENLNNKAVGIEALKKLRSSLIKMSVNPIDNKNKQFANQIRLLKNAVRIAETTASGYRKFYALFLNDAHIVTGISEFKMLSQIWDDIARLWNQIISQPWSDYETRLWLSHINSIIEKETQAYEDTLNIFR